MGSKIAQITVKYSNKRRQPKVRDPLETGYSCPMETTTRSVSSQSSPLRLRKIGSSWLKSSMTSQTLSSIRNTCTIKTSFRNTYSRRSRPCSLRPRCLQPPSSLSKINMTRWQLTTSKLKMSLNFSSRTITRKSGSKAAPSSTRTNMRSSRVLTTLRTSLRKWLR